MIGYRSIMAVTYCFSAVLIIIDRCLTSEVFHENDSDKMRTNIRHARRRESFAYRSAGNRLYEQTDFTAPVLPPSPAIEDINDDDSNIEEDSISAVTTASSTASIVTTLDTTITTIEQFYDTREDDRLLTTFEDDYTEMMTMKNRRRPTTTVFDDTTDELSLSASADDNDEGDNVVEDNERISYAGGGQNNNDTDGRDVMTRFLRIVEMQQELGENCTAGTDLNLGEGVVDRYGQERFRTEAEVAVNRANMLTRLWKYAGEQVTSSEYLLHASVLSMVEFNENIFAAGNCYDLYQYKNYWLFCPYAYRLPTGSILVKDLAIEYKYLSSSNEWFYRARLNAEKVIRNDKQYSYGFHTYTWNDTTHTDREPDEILSVTYEDGRWSKPYYDCGGGNIWMLTYTVPFFGYKNGTYFFKGTSGIDIDLRKVDIDQCPPPIGSKNYNIFASSDKCKKRTTYCEPIKGLGFRRGSYRCVCRRGFYFGNTSDDHNYFDGSVIEEEYEKLMLGEKNVYNKSGYFQCLQCADGCDQCVDNRPCVLSLNWYLRSVILTLSCLIILFLPVVNYFTYRYKNVKVVRAASPVLLRVIVVGAFFIYCTIIVMYPVPTLLTCTVKIWFREIGFSLTYGALMLKTWRISIIFHVKSARTVKITDVDLLKKLAAIVTIFGGFLVVRTLVDPPMPKVVRTTDDLKTYLCETNWWDHWFTIMEGLFLVWGIRLCIMVRKAPSEFNESKFISMAIYNEFLLSLFLNITMLFLQSPANPDLLYIISFCHTQITITLLLCFIFGSKAYMVYKGEDGKTSGDENNIKLPATKYLCRPTTSSGGMSQTYASTSSINVAGLVFESKSIVAPTEPDDLEVELNALLKQVGSLKDRNAKCNDGRLITKLNDLYEYIRLTYDETTKDKNKVVPVDNPARNNNDNNEKSSNNHYRNENNNNNNNNNNVPYHRKTTTNENNDYCQYDKSTKKINQNESIAHHNIIIQLEDGTQQPKQILL